MLAIYTIISDLFFSFSRLYKLVSMARSDVVEKLFPKPGICSQSCLLIWEALCGCDCVVPSASCVLQNPRSPRCATSPWTRFPWLQLWDMGSSAGFLLLKAVLFREEPCLWETLCMCWQGSLRCDFDLLCC